MIGEDKVVKGLSKLLGGWDFSFVVSLGRSERNITG
jgi:hypothetical protein